MFSGMWTMDNGGLELRVCENREEEEEENLILGILSNQIIKFDFIANRNMLP